MQKEGCRPYQKLEVIDASDQLAWNQIAYCKKAFTYSSGFGM
jgi:hypothetical protein